MAARRNEQQQDDGIPVRFALLLDATDQFFDGGKDLDQLTPEVLGNYGIVLVSAADGTVAIKAAKKFTTIDVPAFTPALKAQLIQNILYRYRKTLPAELAYILASAPQADSPLFLSLALEELRVDARHENLSAKIEAILQSPDAAHLFLQRFLLDEDYGRTENPALAAHFMALLGASRSGLSENELSELLALPTDPIPERTGQPKLPQIYLSRLLTAFQPFLLNKQGCHAPMHRLLGVAAQDELSNEVLRKKIYKYFKSKCLKDNLSINQRYASETIYQLIRLTEENSDNKKILKKRIKSYLSEVVTVLQLEDHYLLLEALKILDEHDFRFIQRKWKKFIFFKSRSDLDQSIIDSMRGYGTWLSSHGIFRPAIKILTFLEEWQIIHNKERDDVSSTTNSLANIYVTVGEFNRAKFLYEKNLEMDISIFGEDSEVAATGYNNLGLLLSDIGNYNESKALLIKALSIRKRILGNNHRYTASTLNNMACLLSQMKNTDEAIEYQNQALIIQNTILDSIHEDIADSHSNLGFLMMRKGDYYLSEMHFRLANSIDEKRVGREHYLTGISLGGLGRVLYKSNRIKESCSTLNGAYLIHTKTLGLAHSFTKISLSNYIDALLADNNLEEVISTYDRAMNSISTTDMDTRIDIIKIFANAYFGFEAFHKKAKSLYEDALRLEEKNKGHYHKDTLETLQSLAVLLRDIGELESAEILLSELIVKITAIHRKDSLEIASALSAKGVLLKLKQDIDGAKDCFNQALKIRQKMLGSEHELSQLVRQRLIDLE
jgi:tetratricopeptide (TPR) repeat protein